ncbi:hypothetical protein IV203_037211 [Nitzschia inconspicua]|uniref:FPL domain-containing protein n=1 Tax=Nitzschia inconspicua TaxID=303405 RepID=A0A9K3LKE7_9STRA|nr:hypothetical protein IV203_037211 [Nitzschia inconspicua]
MFRSAATRSANDGDGAASPIQELTSLLEKVEKTVDKSMKNFIDSIAPYENYSVSNEDTSPNKRSSVLDSLIRLRRKENKDDSSPGEKKVDDAADSVAAETSNQDDEKVVPEVENLSLGEDAFVTPKKDSATAATTTETTSNETSAKKKNVFTFEPKEPKARFVPMPYTDMAQMVETVRRIAELVVVGERAAATISSETAKLDSKQWNDDTTEEEKLQDEEYVQIQDKIAEQEPYASIFDLFFEKNGLELITDVLTGKAFDLTTHLDRRVRDIEQAIAVIQNNVEGADEETKLERLDKCESKLKALDELKEMEKYHGMVLLPPLAVATQGFQSVSILVQNVKRATSLFFILSNNHINQLINFPLDDYHIAERSKLESIGGPGVGTTPTFISPRRFSSPELAELTTTFVTFLKSLALRMNAETLQFFLTYPGGTTIESDTDYLEDVNDDPDELNGDDGERPLDEVVGNKSAANAKKANRPVSVKTIQVEFPLYDRALEFCSAQQDSFVRVTAMNICMNTLRLTTVAPKQGEDEPEVDMENATGDSPDAALHNAKALPLRERLAIAQYVCTPSRVEKLASPIFTKLAQLWGILEEQFRDVESSGKEKQLAASNLEEGAKDDPTLRANDKVARAREIARRQKYSSIFCDTSDNLQDELLLLEDVLRVGLTSFNEQTIEMMFATFVYPLLLQPLVVYFQRNPIGAEFLFADALNDHSAGKEVKQSDTTAIEKAVVSAPARSALFCLAAAFQFLTNMPLLRLLFTAVFHPLSPDASGETMIRAKADVACMGDDGKAAIRIDPVDENGKVICETDRSSYAFGTVTGRKTKTATGDSNSEETCVFVLAPALMEILEFNGDDGGIVARSRHNPYRKAIFQCFTLSKEVSDLESLSVIAVDSAVSAFDEKFLSDILFGLDIKRYRDNLPRDEGFKSILSEPDLDDRDIGGPGTLATESRLSLGAPEGGKLGFDYMSEVISAFKSSLINAGPAGKGVWRLDYDMVAAHALLVCVRGNSEAIHRAEAAVKSRCSQAASFLADAPKSIDKFAHEQLSSVWETISPTVEGEENNRDDNLYFGAIMDMIVRGNKPSILSNFLWLKQDLATEEHEVPIYVSISTVGNYSEVGERACTYSPLEAGGAETALKNSVWSTGAWFKINALGSMLESLGNGREHVLQNQKLGGFVFNQSSDPIFPYPADGKTIYSFISSTSDNAMFGVDKKDSTHVEAKPGAVLDLVGKIAFPCVCEVPPACAPLFSEAGAKVVSQGITWQSLYLVILGHDLVLVEPEKRSRGEGRVVTRCKLEDLIIEKDPDDARTDTTARRLIVINYNTDLKPPGLFQFGKAPNPEEQGPFYKVKRWKSGLDIWFENSHALSLAYEKVGQSIAKAKAERGSFIRRYLSEGGV